MAGPPQPYNPEDFENHLMAFEPVKPPIVFYSILAGHKFCRDIP
jgi:hypothetical protein